MQAPNPANPGQDVFCVFPVDPVSGNPLATRSPTDVILGKVPGIAPFLFSGVKTGISNATAEVVETIATVLAPMAGVGMFVSSSNAADVGAQIRITALGPDGAQLAPITVTLQGTTPIALGTLSRINQVFRVSGDVLGTVSIKNAGGTQTYGFLEAGTQFMRSASFTIPAGYRAAIQIIIGAMLKSAGGDAGVIFSLRMKPMSSNSFGSVISLASYRAGNSQIQAFQDYSTSSVGPMDVEIVALASATGCDAQVYISGVLIDASIYP